MAHYVYILECRDKTLYIGSTNNIEKRLAEHNGTKRGAKYTKARRPVSLRYSEAHPTLGAALSREAALKRFPRARKLALFA